jgi:hypothetical protein
MRQRGDIEAAIEHAAMVNAFGTIRVQKFMLQILGRAAVLADVGFYEIIQRAIDETILFVISAHSHLLFLYFSDNLQLIYPNYD